MLPDLRSLFDRRTIKHDAVAGIVLGVESNPGRSHDVRAYAREIGYSERTVSRACQKVTGQSAKAVLDERLVLEARRLLAHTDKPASEIGVELGFSEASNFHKFFRRHTNERPGQFRRTLRRPA